MKYQKVEEQKEAEAIISMKKGVIEEREGQLSGVRVALSGGIDRVEDDGVKWRKYIKTRFKEEDLGLKVFDPCDKPNGLGSEVGVEKDKVKNLIKEDKWVEAKEFVKTFRHYDLRAIDWCDFVIVKIDIMSHLCGTYDEIFLAERELKPVFVIMGKGQTKYDIPTWLISFIRPEEIFKNEDECVDYLIRIDEGEIELDDRWVKLD